MPSAFARFSTNSLSRCQRSSFSVSIENPIEIGSFGPFLLREASAPFCLPDTHALTASKARSMHPKSVLTGLIYRFVPFVCDFRITRSSAVKLIGRPCMSRHDLHTITRTVGGLQMLVRSRAKISRAKNHLAIEVFYLWCYLCLKIIS